MLKELLTRNTLGASNEITRLYRRPADAVRIDTFGHRPVRSGCVEDQRAIHSPARRYHEFGPVAAHQTVVRGQGRELGARDLRASPAEGRPAGGGRAL